MVFGLWAASLALLLEIGAARLWSASPAAIVVGMLVRTYLTTGLFITAHDAMHGAVSRSRPLNRLVGTLAAFSFAAMSYRKLARNHYAHHAAPATDRDPDYTGQGPAGFWRWFARFMLRYATWTQLVTIAIIYNLLRLRYDDATLWLFWAGPPLLASLQLFFFGTYLPHRTPHDDLGPHRARTLPAIHSLAMLSCYFFGYHREHHESPSTPWWRLYALKH
jgi:beta-carotene ketolase (CrtW type)